LDIQHKTASGFKKEENQSELKRKGLKNGIALYENV